MQCAHFFFLNFKMAYRPRRASHRSDTNILIFIKQEIYNKELDNTYTNHQKNEEGKESKQSVLKLCQITTNKDNPYTRV